jgi:hypothetical protein
VLASIRAGRKPIALYALASVSAVPTDDGARTTVKLEVALYCSVLVTPFKHAPTEAAVGPVGGGPAGSVVYAKGEEGEGVVIAPGGEPVLLTIQ